MITKKTYSFTLDEETINNLDELVDFYNDMYKEQGLHTNRSAFISRLVNMAKNRNEFMTKLSDKK